MCVHMSHTLTVTVVIQGPAQCTQSVQIRSEVPISCFRDSQPAHQPAETYGGCTTTWKCCKAEWAVKCVSKRQSLFFSGAPRKPPYFGGFLYFWGSLQSWRCLHFWSCLQFWGCFNFWACLAILVHLHFWDYLLFLGVLYLWGHLILGTPSLILGSFQFWGPFLKGIRFHKKYIGVIRCTSTCDVTWCC